MMFILVVICILIALVIVFHSRSMAFALALVGYSYKYFPAYFEFMRSPAPEKDDLRSQVMPMLETVLEPLYDINLIQTGYQMLTHYNSPDCASPEEIHEQLMALKWQLEVRHNSLTVMSRSKSGEMKQLYNERANQIYYKKDYVADYSQYHANETSHLIHEVQKLFV
jgi:hypothetical protein